MKRTPLQRAKALTRKKRLPRVNRARLMRRRAKQFGDQAELCRRLPCVACFVEACRASRVHAGREQAAFLRGAQGVLDGTRHRSDDARLSEAHHTVTRGSGRGRDEHCVPLCREHHAQLDSPGWSAKRFDEHYGVDLRRLAAELHARLESKESA